MAYTKVFAIRARLDDRVKYAVNGEKTELDERIVYTADPEKTDTVRFVTTLNCRPAETAFAAMQKTKKKYKKTGGVLGYHFIQSFAPGEVTPEKAHEIGCEFARRLFGEDYEVVIGTHLDKAHPHNHIVVNSVSRTDGHKYHSSPESYYNDVRGTSDALCRENDLSVITPQGKGKHYAEWKAEQGGKPTVRGVIRTDIDTKTNLKRLIHDGEELTIFSVKQEDLKGFQMEAKRYGVLFYPIINKVEKTGTVEIMAKARDAKQINRIFERMGYPAPVKEDAAAKKENARAPSENSSKERGTGARASTEPAAEKADARPSVRSRLMALQAAAERDGTAPTKDTVREAIQKAMPTRE